MTYEFNGKQISKEEMINMIGIERFAETVHITEEMYKFGCYEYQVWEKDNHYAFIPE